MVASVTRSPGIPVGLGFIAGGGNVGATKTLDETVETAAHRLAALFDGPVVIRFNSDRRSGGAWLHTHPVDRVGVNHEVGVTVSDHGGGLTFAVAVDPLLRGGQPDDNRFQSVSSLTDALDALEGLHLGAHADVLEALTVKRRQWEDRYARYLIVATRADPNDADEIIFAPYTPEGYDLLARKTHSYARRNARFHGNRVLSGFIRNGQLRIENQTYRCLWADAFDVPTDHRVILRLVVA